MWYYIYKTVKNDYHQYLYGNLTHDSGMNFDFNTNILGLAQQQHLLTQNSLLLGHVFTCNLQTSWRVERQIQTFDLY